MMRWCFRFQPALVMVVALSACARATFAPAPYASAHPLANLQGRIAPQKALGIAATVEALPPKNRKAIAPGFAPGIYLTAALETELQAAQVPTEAQKKGMYLATQLQFFSPHKVVFDTGVYAEHGQLLYQKRAYCAVYNSNRRFDSILQEALRQIIADPKFSQALHDGARP